jgi:hypothetical protein
MSPRLLLVSTTLALAACGGVPECGSFFARFAATEGCTVKLPPACAEGQVLTIAGTCEDAYNTAEDVIVDPPDTDEPSDTDRPVDTDESDEPIDTGETEEPWDTEVEPIFDCTHEVRLYSGSYASEVGFGIAPTGGSVLFGLEYGDLTTNNNTYTYTVELPAGTYNAQLYDSYADGWNGAYYDIYHVETGDLIAEGTLASGGTSTQPFAVTCLGN